MIVAKFGGTSLADAENIAHAAKLLRQNPNRRYVVVSAPGKRYPGDIKITDLLYRFQQTGNLADFAPIEARFRGIIEKLRIDLDLSSDFEEMKSLTHNADYMASCGEYLSAKIMAAYLGWPFVGAETCVFFDEAGKLDIRKTQQAIFQQLKNLPHAVLPGFYGAMPDGQIHTFSRGGSDISGALVASAMDAEVYENWTDVDGMLVTDPRIVPNAKPIRTITYDELRELAYRGATVLHEESVAPVRKSHIPIHICNTFRPEAEGSWIVAKTQENPGLVTGIAGRKGYSTVQIIREEAIHAVGYIRKILSCLEQLHISVTQLATGMGSVSLVVPTEAIAGCRQQLQDKIMIAVHPDDIRIMDGLAMIAVVGRGMVGKPEVRQQLFSTLALEGINIRVIDQASMEMSILVGVDEDKFEKAVLALHRVFFD